MLTSRADLWHFIGLCLLILLASVAARIGISALAQWSAFDLRLQLGRKWVSTPLPELERDGNARLLAAITQDVDRLSESMRALPGLCIDITVIVACIAYLAYLSWLGLAITLGFMFVAIKTRDIPQKRCERLIAEARGYGEIVLGTFHAMAGGIKELKMNMSRWNAFYTGELYESSAKCRDRNYLADVTYGLIRGYSEIIYFLFVALLIYKNPITGTLSLEKIVGFAVTMLYMKTNFDHVMESSGSITRAQIALGRLEALGVFRHTSSLSISDLRVRTTQEQVVTATKAATGMTVPAATALRHSIRFHGVEYRYKRPDGEEGFLLGPMDLTIDAGELLFVTGGNGSGKTTFAKILCGLYEPSRGEIRLDGTLIQPDNVVWYAQHFGTVFSDSYLFDKLYGTKDLPQTDSLASEYLKEFRLQDKVKVVKGRFSTVSLSQGQRKRLALVTAYMEDRPIYMFDEWAADQDPEFRQFFYMRILPGLKAKGKTVIVISHDDRFYHVADRLVKFEGGLLATRKSEPRQQPVAAQSLV